MIAAISRTSRRGQLTIKPRTPSGKTQPNPGSDQRKTGEYRATKYMSWLSGTS